jgi:hypothetical protein
MFTSIKRELPLLAVFIVHEIIQRLLDYGFDQLPLF